MVVISKQNLSVRDCMNKTQADNIYLCIYSCFTRMNEAALVLAGKTYKPSANMIFNVCLWLAVVQSGLKLDDRGCCESRNLKREVSQKWINAQSLATFNSLESVVFTNKPTLLANLLWFEEKVSLIWNLIGDLNSVASFVKKHHIDLSHLEKNWKNKINCTYNLILK